MLDHIREDLERQVARLLEEAEKPMRVEEILPHLDAVMPDPNDVADVLQDLTAKKAVEREGSFYHRSTPVPIEHLFPLTAHREAAHVIVEIIRDLDARNGDGARFPVVMKIAEKRGIPADRVLDVVAVLRNAGEAYSVGGDRIRLAKP
ncbi:MAG TPA: hypothetical protein VM370_03450 [Candidatus Thermoplasmatota archaeon]|nr:hypothetical protein [Candidatus Thermoplasmatota archaeon]